MGKQPHRWHHHPHVRSGDQLCEAALEAGWSLHSIDDETNVLAATTEGTDKYLLDMEGSFDYPLIERTEDEVALLHSAITEAVRLASEPNFWDGIENPRDGNAKMAKMAAAGRKKGKS